MFCLRIDLTFARALDNKSMAAAVPGDVETGVEHLSNAVAVCGQPQQLLQVLQQTLPSQVFQLLLQRLPAVSQVHTLETMLPASVQ